ncbi:MAG: ABC transporter ATP-binding protein [Myxococcales bacterium]|nr:ABC transporter ATP-binding protein [Myxococcales bacterium]
MSLRSLGKDFGARTAVHAIDLDIRKGQILGLLGPNGAGKTTTISMACGVVTPSRGAVLVDGVDLAAHPRRVKAQLGLVPQELAIYQELDAVQNLSYFGALHGLRGAALRQRVDWALHLAGLTDRAREVTATYSGGMKRRLNLAAGLVHRPRVLILDEPTVGVDPQSRNHVFETVRELAREGMAIVYTSHYMEEVEQLCDQIAIMDGGKIVAVGALPELVAAHARGGLELELEAPAPGGEALTRALAAAAAHAELARDPARPQVVRCEAPARLAPLLAAIEDCGVRVARITSYQSNLETVFLRLTGKALRDAQEGA